MISQLSRLGSLTVHQLIDKYTEYRYLCALYQIGIIYDKALQHHAQRLKIARKSNERPPHYLVRKCLDFLDANLTIRCYENDLSHEKIIYAFEIKYKATRRIARAIHTDECRINANLPNRGITFDEIMSHNSNQLLTLKDHAQHINTILNE